MLVSPYHVNSLLDAFQLAKNLEISLRFSSERRFPLKIEEQSRRQLESSTKPYTSTTKDLKDKFAIGESFQQGTKGVRCF